MDIFDEVTLISQKSGSSSAGNKDLHSKEMIELFAEQGLNENAIRELLDVLQANNISTVNELSLFPLDKLPTLKLKPKARSVLKVVIPKLNGDSSSLFLFDFSYY